ncbi:hypothetical protein RSSM_04856 [Rhodopirellula sallentina SM41]|uniref:Uncharacterized protein n=1 Tax=Rhodopirellula sallentina SM41 TaxID=1263870 RepID=M5TX24_9BACT|nr:hypothetical protein RSSM_04856 [Rhodopirellula sallentina SM41]
MQIVCEFRQNGSQMRLASELLDLLLIRAWISTHTICEHASCAVRAWVPDNRIRFVRTERLVATQRHLAT